MAGNLLIVTGDKCAVTSDFPSGAPDFLTLTSRFPRHNTNKLLLTRNKTLLTLAKRKMTSDFPRDKPDILALTIENP